MGYIAPPIPTAKMLVRAFCAYCGMEQAAEPRACATCGASEIKWVSHDPRQVSPAANVRVFDDRDPRHAPPAANVQVKLP